jgi:hypothetical protein
LGYIALPRHRTVKQDADLVLGEENRLSFDLEVKPNQGGWDIGAGTYRLHVALASVSTSVRRSVLRIYFSGQWTEDEERMFRDEIQIQIE